MVKLVTCASECLTKLHSESDFLELWEKADDTEMPRPPKRKRTISKGLQEYLLEETLARLKVIWEIKKSSDDYTTVLWTQCLQKSRSVSEKEIAS